MTIEACIQDSFPEGLSYDDAAQLCILLYSAKVLPDELMSQCNKDNLAVAFSNLVSTSFVNVSESEIVMATRYGARLHDPRDKGHWIEVIASVLKLGEAVYSRERWQYMKERLTNGCRGRAKKPARL